MSKNYPRGIRTRKLNDKTNYEVIRGERKSEKAASSREPNE
jgi:hypothetical protein